MAKAAPVLRTVQAQVVTQCEKQRYGRADHDLVSAAVDVKNHGVGRGAILLLVRSVRHLTAFPSMIFLRMNVNATRSAALSSATVSSLMTRARGII